MMRRAVIFLFVLFAACGDVAVESTQPIVQGKINPKVNVVSWSVNVSRELTTSEANAYYPMVDIVWRDDPPGDRHAQVEKVLRDATAWGMSSFRRGRPVTLSIDLVKFHALSQKARYTTGGVHTIRFVMSVKDARTGEYLMEPRKIVADLRAYGAANAIEADRVGRTQKVRITQHIAGTLQQVLIGEGMGTLVPGDDG